MRLKDDVSASVACALMPRVLLAWEFGRGRGHILKLKQCAAALRAPALVDAVLCSMDFSVEIAGLCETIIQGPGLTYDRSVRAARGNPITSTWGEFLGDLGFRDPEFMASQISWWQDLILERRIGLVISDYAPFAVLAARGLGIKVVGTGIGYSLGPATLNEFPVLIERFSERIHDEVAMTAAVNDAGAPYGLPKLSRFPEINLMDDMLVHSLPFFDPYQHLRDKPYLPPNADAPSELTTGGSEIFLYASGQELHNSAFLEAITSLGVPVRIYAPGIKPELAMRLQAADSVNILPSSLPVDEIAARSRLMIHAGQPSSMTMALACGLTQVAVPQHLEHQFHAEKLMEFGTVSILSQNEADASVIKATILETYHSDSMKRRAVELASEYTPLIKRDARPLIRQRLNEVMMPR